MKIEVKHQQSCALCHKVFSSDRRQIYCDPCQERIDNAPVERKEKMQKSPKLKLSYTFELFRINKSSLKKFIFTENRRRTSQKQKSSLKKSLMSGKHFDSPIVVNEAEEKLRILDGNHRIEEITGIMKKYPKFWIDVLLIKYSNLDSDGEIEAFRKWNIGKIQSLDDFIQSISREVKIIGWIKKDFSIPVNIYKTRDSISMRTLFNAYLAAIRMDDKGHSLKREGFARELFDMEEDDYRHMKEFCSNFSKVFSRPKPKNNYYNASFFNAAMYVAYEYSDKKDLWDKMKANVLGNEDVQELALFGNRVANKKMISLIKKLLRLKLRPKISEEDFILCNACGVNRVTETGGICNECEGIVG